MPTTLERRRRFFAEPRCKALAVTIYDPTTSFAVPGQQDSGEPGSAATAAALLQYFPNPNLASAAQIIRRRGAAEQLAEASISRDLQRQDWKQGYDQTGA